MAIQQHAQYAAAVERVFARVLVGVDGTEPGFEACRQATALLAPEGWIELAYAVHFAEAALGGAGAVSLIADELEREARHALCLGAELAGHHVGTALLDGKPTQALLHEARAENATLVAVGTHGRSRAPENLLGRTAAVALHAAPCSVLVARRPHLQLPFPSRIVAGTDGSAESAKALAVAEGLSERFAAPLRVVAAERGKSVDLARVTPLAEMLDQHPIEALVQSSREADLLVVGSRGLHGVAALGSVSERVAHRAACSVLVVRDRHS